MKTCYLSICILCLLFSGCLSERSNESVLIEFNVSASYPEKEIKLEDISEIEYLQLELDEDFLYNSPQVIISSSKIITFNRHNGDVLVFSREGKPLSKFNHQGNGPGEYIVIPTNGVVYDETTDELFVVYRNIMVYSLSGEFKRSMPLPSLGNIEIVNYDAQTFLLYEELNQYPTPPFSLISKENGSLVETIDIPTGKNVFIHVVLRHENNISVIRAPAYRIVKHNAGYLLTDFSTDTLYYLSPEKKLSPILARKPAIQSMDPVVTLNGFVEAGNYEFVSVVPAKLENNRFPVTYLMRDKKTGSIYRQKITFNGYKGKEVTLSPETIANTQNSKLGLIVLGLTELQDANRENRLSGRLKELVENSDEDGNDIYMLLHFK